MAQRISFTLPRTPKIVKKPLKRTGHPTLIGVISHYLQVNYRFLLYI